MKDKKAVGLVIACPAGMKPGGKMKRGTKKRHDMPMLGRGKRGRGDKSGMEY